jgi:hypothetical protein
MGRSHVLPDEEFGMGQPGNYVALAIGYQDRGCRRQSALFEMAGQPGQVEPGEYDTRDMPIAILKPLRKVYHPLVAGGVDPVIPYSKLWLR